MSSSETPRPPQEPERRAEGYYRRDADEFHREANVLAGHDPAAVSSTPPENLRRRRWFVFAIIVLAGLVAAGIAVGLMAVPQCENPPYNWMPCIPDLSG